VRAVVRLLLLLLALPATAHAATPTPAAAFAVHDHATPGDNWHVEVRTNGDSTQLRDVVVHSQRCGSHTPYAFGVPVDADGIVSHEGSFEGGMWRFDGRFTESHRLDGTFRIVTPDCDTGPLVFVAHAGGHAHGVAYGPAHGTMPDPGTAAAKRLRQARRLHRGSLRWAAERFPTYRRALKEGYKATDKVDLPWLRPHVYHLRRMDYTRDRDYFNPRNPEGLVYYNPPAPTAEPQLLALMFRYRLGPQPAFAKPLLPWHSHGNGIWKGVPNQMTHVWLTRDLRSALANCLPARQLARSIPGFAYTPPAWIDHESAPCPDAAAG
jgi:hypothetical protein